MNRELKLNLLSAALDLKRVSVGFQNGSPAMQDRFRAEALAWLDKIPNSEVAPYIARTLKQLPAKLTEGDAAAQAETALTYSLILQNYAVSN